MRKHEYKDLYNINELYRWRAMHHRNWTEPFVIGKPVFEGGKDVGVIWFSADDVIGAMNRSGKEKAYVYISMEHSMISGYIEIEETGERFPMNEFEYNCTKRGGRV